MGKNIKSMTGFGKGVCELDGKRITVEIRSLNSKQLDLNVKLPSSYRDSEFAIRTLVSKTLVRGKVDVFVNTELLGGKTCMPINIEVVNEYYNQFKACNIDFTHADFLQTIMRLPDTILTERNEVSEEEIAALFTATELAINAIDEFRIHEGAVLMNDILNRIDQIETLKTELLSYEGERMQTVRARLRESLDKLSQNVDENRFEQELIYYLEKLDITEEKVRLQKHLDYFRAVCGEEEEVGRKIGFITQEIGREINTTGSKSNHAQMQQCVVKMKDELEKI
ncbi:MAG: DUF1732 domain-containing protein, partial [Rikenellaceae bacterium]